MSKVRKWTLIFLLLALLVPAQAEAQTMQALYLVPVEQVGSARGPKYFSWK